MNHVKRISARKSMFIRSYPWKRVLVGMILNMVLWIYIAHMGLFDAISYYIDEGNYGALVDIFFNIILKGMLLGGGITLLALWIYIAYRRCREEYACDVQGIEDSAILRGGIDWLLHDAKAYVDGLFNGPLRFLRPLYKLFPNALCSFFTLHPHPIARAKRLEEKIAQLQARG